jgi:hypothetical protein
MATDQERNVFGCRTGKGGLRSLRGIFRPRGPACQTRRDAAISNNYVNAGSWTPSLPGDGGPGAADRYLEAFAQSVVRPLTGQ